MAAWDGMWRSRCGRGRDGGQGVAAGVADGIAAAEPCRPRRAGCGKQGGWPRVTQDEQGRF